MFEKLRELALRTHSAEWADRGPLTLKGLLQAVGVEDMATGQKHGPGEALLLVSCLMADAALDAGLYGHVSDWQHHTASSSDCAWERAAQRSEGASQSHHC